MEERGGKVLDVLYRRQHGCIREVRTEKEQKVDEGDNRNRKSEQDVRCPIQHMMDYRIGEVVLNK